MSTFYDLARPNTSVKVLISVECSTHKKTMGSWQCERAFSKFHYYFPTTLPAPSAALEFLSNRCRERRREPNTTLTFSKPEQYEANSCNRNKLDLYYRNIIG